jgi:hypothetical protein
MNRSGFSLFSSALAVILLFQLSGRAAGQEIALTPMQATEVAKGYRAAALKLREVVNEKGDSLGRISDFIFGKDGNIYAILAVGDFAGISGHLVAVPLRSFKLDDPSESIILPGTSRAALDKLPVYVKNQ